MNHILLLIYVFSVRGFGVVYVDNVCVFMRSAGEEEHAQIRFPLLDAANRTQRALPVHREPL